MDFFSLHQCVQAGSGVHPDSCPMCIGGYFPGVKWPGYEADLSSPSCSEVKNARAISPFPIHLHGTMLS
jgi:hypothetical protein